MSAAAEGERSSRLAVHWEPRRDPLEPAGLFVSGGAATAYARMLVQRSMEGLSGVATNDALVILGSSDRLGWVDGARYLGRDPLARSLYLPTELAPSCPVALLERALSSKARGASPLAVVPERRELVSLAAAAPIVLARLEDWLKGR